MADPCPHGMPSPASCWECMEDGNLPALPRPEPLTVVSRPFAARFDGHCPGCNTEIHAGQPIVRLSDDTHRHDFLGCLP